MSCDSRRKNVLRRLLGNTATPDVIAALEQGYKTACTSQREPQNPSDQLFKTIAFMQLCDRFGLPRPVHNASGLPRSRNHRGYAYLFDALLHRGVFSTAVPDPIVTVKGEDVPLWAMVQERCGCRAIRVPPPPRSAPYPFFMRLKMGNQPDCEHEGRPIGWIGWCFDEGFTIIEEPPPRANAGPAIEPIPEGIYPALDQRLVEARQHYNDPTERAYAVAGTAFNVPADQRKPFLCEALYYLGATQKAGLDWGECIAAANIAIYYAENGDLENALFLVGMIPSSYQRNDVLTRLVCKLPADTRGQYIDECLSQLENDYDRDEIRERMILNLVKGANDGVQVLKILATFENSYAKLKTLHYCATLPDDTIPTLIAMARTIDYPSEADLRAYVLSAYIPRLAGHERDALIEEVLTLADEDMSSIYSTQALEMVATALSPDQDDGDE